MTTRWIPTGCCVVLVEQKDIDQRSVLQDRCRKSESMLACASLLEHFHSEKSRTWECEFSDGRIELSWSMTTGHRVNAEWSKDRHVVSITMKGTPDAILTSIASGAPISHERPWNTAASLAVLCRIAAEAILLPPDDHRLNAGEDIRSALGGWIEAIREKTGHGRLHASSATPWEPAVAWHEGSGERLVLDGIGLPAPMQQGIAILDDPASTVMGSIVVSSEATDPMERIRAIRAYRESTR